MSFPLFFTKGFLTPRNQNIVARKALFSEKAKVALGDLKNTAFKTITPMKNSNVFIEKTKTDTPAQLATPNLKNFTNIPFTPEIIDHFCTSHKSIEEMWSEHLMLSNDQFNLLFMEPNIGIAPPSPAEEPLPEFPVSDIEVPSSPSSSWTRFDYKSTDNSDDDDLPPLNMDFFSDDFGVSPLKENDGKIANRISGY